jgi:hypothetical protein
VANGKLDTSIFYGKFATWRAGTTGTEGTIGTLIGELAIAQATVPKIQYLRSVTKSAMWDRHYRPFH